MIWVNCAVDCGWPQSARMIQGLTDVFLNRGARVVATDIELDRLRRAARARDWPAERLLAKRLDVTDPMAWDAVYRELVARWERLDLLLNVAGVIRPVWLAEARPQDVHRHIDVNFKGVAFGSRTVARRFEPAPPRGRRRRRRSSPCGPTVWRWPRSSARAASR